MLNILPTVATITAMIAVAVSTSFMNANAATSNRVDTLAASIAQTSNSLAAVGQSNKDIDDRLTRIENKLDQLSMK